MRELKFRAWVECAETMIYDVAPNVRQASNGKPLVIEQFTGLKDKNGKEIYEGDIVSEEFEYDGEKVKTIWQVRWCDDECAFEIHYVSGFEVDDCSLVADDEENYEIIGNIHENPELIKEKE